MGSFIGHCRNKNAFCILIHLYLIRFINTDGKRFVKDFQGEISEKVKFILKDHLNK